MFIRATRRPRLSGPRHPVRTALVRALVTVLRIFFILLLLVLPIPIAPRRLPIPKPDRRNQPTQVVRKE